MGVAVVIAIVLILLAAAAVILSTVRRREVSNIAAGLSRESVKRDRTRRQTEAAEAAEAGVTAPVGREIERAAVLARSGTAVVAADSKAPTLWVPPDPETYGVTRRQFLNRSIVTFMGINIAIFGVISLPVFLWPSSKGGFGSKIRVGKVADIKADIAKANGFLYNPDGRMYLVEYPATALPKARVAYKGLTSLPGMEVGIVALYQKCVHLGCRVPQCNSSKWFECPCHGSQYNMVGEKKGGPAPRGLDRFGIEIAGDVLTVNTGDIVLGPPIGTNTTGQEAEGPHCV